MSDKHWRAVAEKELADLSATPLGSWRPPDVLLPDDLIRRWRASLADANAQVLKTVSESMAETIAAGAAVHLPRFMLPDSDPALRRVAEPDARYLSLLHPDLTAALYRLLQPAALAAAQDFAAQMQPQADRRRRYQEALWELGWWVPPSVPLRMFNLIGSTADRGDRVALRHQMVESGQRLASRLLTGWMDLDAFRDRRRFLRDGVEDLRRGRYRVSVPMLIPQLEGIAFDVFAPGSPRTSPVGVLSDYVLSTAAGDAIVETVTVLWARQDFSVIPSGSRRLNRHLVLHGRSTGYGTAENAVKVLFALDQLASTVRRTLSTP